MREQKPAEPPKQPKPELPRPELPKVEQPKSPVKVEQPKSPVKVEQPKSPVKVEQPKSPVKVEQPKSPGPEQEKSQPGSEPLPSGTPDGPSLFAFGGKKDDGFPRPPRDSDLQVSSPDQPVGPFSPTAATDAIPGASTFTSVDAGRAEGLQGQVFRLPEGTQMPAGYAVHADGVDAGGLAPDGHRTIYPSRRMSAEDFQIGYGSRDFGWEWHGTVNKKGVFTPAPESAGDGRPEGE